MTRTGSAGTGPPQNDPAQNAQNDPAQNDPAGSGPTGTGQARKGPAQNDPAQNDPAGNALTGTSLTGDGQTRNGPRQNGPARGGYGPAQLARLLGLPEPTAEQAAVISAPAEPLAVIAGAGSGKSETMAARLVWMVANGMVRPERVLGLTFTRKAAAELGQRVRTRLDGLRRAGLGPADADDHLDGEPVVSTYHAYAARLVGDHALREALEPSLRLVTPAVAWQIAAKVVAGYGGPMDAVSWSPPAVTAAVLTLAGELAEHLRTPDEVRAAGEWLTAQSQALAGKVPGAVRKILACQQTREQLLPIVAAYTRAKAAREMIDHGDQVALAARIAARHPEVGVAERGRYQVVLLDEYQDTSHAQLVLLRALFGGGHPVTAVGDPCQSIYGWRGASAGNLRRFGRDFPLGPDRAGQGSRAAARRPAPVRLLSTSFRNTGRVLDAAAALQEGLRAEAPEVPRLVPPPDRADRGQVICALTQTSAAEADWIAEQISALLAMPPGTAPDGGPWPDGREAGVRPSDIAVLCRKRAQFPALRTAIEARGIPVEVVGLGGLLAVPEVADIVATLRVLQDPAASGPLARLLTGPRWRIGPRDLVALGRRARELAREQRASAVAARAAEPGDQASPGGQASPGDQASPGGQASSGGQASLFEQAGPGGQASLFEQASPAEDTPGGSAARPVTGNAGSVGGSVKPDDALARAVTDLTADPGSLVEALDDLGEAGGYSPAGHARFAALAAELRTLRTHAARPLADLVGEVERTLGLDVEVAARLGRDPASARTDLDAFADAAAAFAGDQEEPTLGAFLAYLAAAEEEEFGLEAGRVGEADTVTLATVHAAKGLQWAAVVVPGLAAGKKAQVFPAKPRVTTRWTENARLLPFGLRGDAGDLPRLSDLSAESLASFTSACAARDLAEERRLAYVATTRAAFWLACTGYWWGDGASPLGPSEFLDELRAACAAGAGVVATWAPPPEEDEENPALAEPASAAWPAAPGGPRYEAIREAAVLVQRAQLDGRLAPDRLAPDRLAPDRLAPDRLAPDRLAPDRLAPDRLARAGSPAGGPAAGGPAAGSPAYPGPVPGGPVPGGPVPGGPDQAGNGQLSDSDQVLLAAWARDTDLLLAERDERRTDATAGVWLPGRLSVSSLVVMARDPAELARQIRRPMPRPPAPQARRGTAFHRWLEERFGQQRLIDPGDLLGAADDPADDEASDLTALRELFEAGDWGNRWPLEVEVPFETLIGDRPVRGRIDAVFADAPDGGFDVVDWKTGRPPGSEADRRAVAVQLAAYRLAWAGLAGVPVAEVRAAFYYVRENLTLRPADLLDEPGLAALIEGIPTGSG